MSDQINKTLILSARLDTSSLGPDLKKLKSELSMDGMQLDQSTINSFKKDFAEIAKSFATELNKAMRGTQGGGSKGGGGKGGKGSSGLNASAQDIKNFRNSQSKTLSKEQNQPYIERQKEELRVAKETAKAKQRENQKANKEAAYYDQYRNKGNQKDHDKALLEKNNKEVRAAKETAMIKKREDLKASKDLAIIKRREEAKVNKEAKYYDDYRKNGNENALGMPAEQASIRKERDERKKMQKTLADDKEKRELGVLYRIGQASKNYFKTGKFDFIQESDKADFRSKAKGMGMALPAEEGTAASRILGAGGGAALRMGGVALGAAGAVVGGVVAAGAMVNKNADRSRESRIEIANQRNELASGAASGNVLEAGVISQSRKKVGSLEKMVARVSGDVKDVMFGLPDGFKDFRAGKGAQAEVARRGRAEGEANLAETDPLLKAYNNTIKPSMASRVEMLAGGGLSSQSLTNLQGTGAKFGLGTQESLSALGTIKGTLGNSFLAGEEGNKNFSEMMDLQKRYGIDVGTSAQGVESLRGNSSGGMSHGAALTIERDGLRKAVSAGLDASKTGKFLETTTSYISNNAGLATMDGGSLQDSILSLAKGFATQGGRSDITETDLSKAKSARETMKASSMSTSGLSGAGNYLGISQVMQDAGVSDQDIMIGAYGMSSDSTEESYKNLYKGKNLSEETQARLTKGFMSNKSKGGDAFLNGARGVGIQDNQQGLLSYLRRGETGMTGEASLAMNNLPNTKPLSASGPETQGAHGTEDMKNTINSAAADFVQFSGGIKMLNTVNEQYKIQLDILIDSIGIAADKLKTLGVGSQTTRVGKEGRAREPGK